ncbi:CRAL-TRIO domain-containing protein [Sporodiniella umbellata]|nr:CRAL-TRIO domain-containing protein [Sporodiniella umbellata]
MSPATTDVTLTGHVGNLSASQEEHLKKLWSRLFELFGQKGTEYKPEAKKEEPAPVKKSGYFGFGKKTVVEEKSSDLFIGTTTDPSWMTLPLEKAMPLIPGNSLRNTFWGMVATDNPDAVLLRFLRARKWDLDAAYNMLVNTLRWRLSMRVDDIVSLGESGIRDELNKLKPEMGDSFITQLNSGKAYLGGPDKAGRGICFINVKLHKKEDQQFEVVKLLTMYVMETSRVIVHQPVESACIVFNMDGFTLKNMDFDFVKFLVTCFEAYYPETLGSCLIHKAPWVFSTVWNLITPLLDPVVASKIHFTKDLNELTQYVDMSALPAIVSGDKTKQSKDESISVGPVAPGTLARPTTEAFSEYQAMIKQYEAETLEWSKAPSKENDVETRHELAREFRLSRVKTEKDIRGPTAYEAKGLLTINSKGRAILDFGGDWTALDITENV